MALTACSQISNYNITVLVLNYIVKFTFLQIDWRKAAKDVMYALFELDEHYNMPLYEVANPEAPTEKHIAVGFDYSLLDDFLNTWKKKKEDLADRKITKEEYFEWKINWPHAED